METFYDEGLDLTIQTNMGYSPAAYEYNSKIALAHIEELESGAIVNKTSVATESENRPVDHYNLRHEKELVNGKSLAKSLEQWAQVQQFVGKHSAGFKHVVFNGIGGSYLGPYMLIQAIHGDEYNLVQARCGRPSLHFVANTDSDSFSALFSQIDIKETLMVVISKSGSTAETATNTAVFERLLKEQGIDHSKHMCAITISGSNLHKKCVGEGWLASFEMYEATGGRTSICSSVAMVPCAFAAIDFAAFLKGMSAMDKATRRAEANPALHIACLVDSLLQRASVPKNMIILGYSDSLKQYYHYCQQLYMESLGKEYTRDGRHSPRGLTVYGGIGTSEQHAFMQQIEKGVSDSFVKFIQFEKRRYSDYVDEKAGTMGRELLAFLKGTELALLQNGREFMTVTVRECSEYCLGQLIALEERVVTCLASFWDINAYDEPGVQDGKLAANRVNALSLKLDAGLTECKDADAEAILHQLGISESWQLAESLLSDMVANPESYKNGLHGSRRHAGGRFLFTFWK